MDSKTIRDKALKGLSAKNDDGEIEPVWYWGLDEEEEKEGEGHGLLPTLEVI